MKAIKFCFTESKGELKDYARNKLKNLEDELIAKLKSALKEAVVKLYICLLLCLGVNKWMKNDRL